MIDPRRQNLKTAAVIGTAVCLIAACMLAWSWSNEAGGAGDATPTPVAAARAVAHLGTSEHDAARRRESATARNGFYSAPVGSEFTYELQSDARVRMTMKVGEQPADQQTSTSLKGRMRVLVLDRRERELVVQVSFLEASVHHGIVGGLERSPALTETLALPTRIRMRDDGSLLGFAFDANSHAYAHNLIRSVVCGFRFVVPADAADAWEQEETDPTGIATVRYQWIAGQRPESDQRQVQRVKTDYRALAGEDNRMVMRYAVRGTGVGDMDPELGWLRGAEVTESLEMDAQGAPVRTALEYTARLRLTTQTMRPVDELAAPGWADAWAPVDGGLDTIAIAQNSERELNELELGAATLASLLQDILALAGAEPLDHAALTAASRKLALLVRLRPEVLDELAQVVPTTPPFAADVVLGAIGSANTAPAQRYLSGVVGDTAAVQSLRQSALDSMIQLAEPGDAAVQSVLGLVRDGGANATLRDNGLLVLGALGSRAPAAGAPDAGNAMTQLIAYRDRAVDEGRLEVWLHALGNTGRDEVAPAVEPYLAHADPSVRHAATSALRSVETPRATAALLERAQRDADPRVRGRAIESLAERSDPSALTYVGTVLAEETDADLRRAAIDGLRKQLPTNASVRPMLQGVADRDPSPELRRHAAGVLAPR